MRVLLTLSCLLAFAACEEPAEPLPAPAQDEPAPLAEPSAPEQAAVEDPYVVIPTVIGPGATEADFIASQSDAELYPDLTPEGAALARVLFYELPRDAYGAQLLALLPLYDCRVPVRDGPEMLAFEDWAGTTALIEAGMPAQDIPSLAEEYGYLVVGVGNTRLDEDVFIYDDDSAVTGLRSCQ
ncbi:hypothetical protein ACXN5S_08280 [Pseudoroseicyclus sp. H15]